MNCSLVRPLLPVALYGDLSPEEAASVEEHLTSCPACRRERAELERVRAALTAMSAPLVQVDLPALYRQTAESQARRVRRWRRTALALCGVAAALLLVIGLRLEVRVAANQLTVRWGSPPEKAGAPPKQPPAPPIRVERPKGLPAQEVRERLRLMDELIHALTADMQERDVQQHERLARIQERLNRLGEQAQLWQTETERNVAALYAAQFVSTKKGDEQ